MLLNAPFLIDASPAVSGVVTITVPAGKVSSDLTDFPLMIDLSHMPLGFWAGVRADGGNIRAYASDGITLIPHDVTHIDKTRSVGRLFVKKTLLSASANVIVLKVLSPGTTVLAVTDPNGRNAVWSDFEVVWVFPSDVNRTGNGYAQGGAGPAEFTRWIRKDYYDMPGNPHQGVAVDSSGNVVTIDTNYLRRSTVAAPTTVLASNADPLSAVVSATGNSNLNHMSDGCIIAGELWVPANEYPVSGGHDEYLCVFNLTTLALDRFYNVSSVGRHISSIAQDPDTGTIWATDYVNGASLMQFNTSGTYLGSVSLSSSISNLQGICFVEGSILLSADATDITKVSKTGVIDVAIGNEFSNPQSGTSEGIAYANGLLFHMDGDGDMTVLEVNDDFADWARLHYENLNATLPRSQVWTMASSVYWLDLTGNLQQAFLSLANGTTSGNRATLANRSATSRLGLWNSTDTWLQNTFNPAYKSVFRTAAQHDGTTERRVFLDGNVEATDSVISARPTGAGTDMNFVVNASDTSGTEDGEAYYQFVWQRNEYMSDAWMAADAANMNDPATFYTVT